MWQGLGFGWWGWHWYFPAWERSARRKRKKPASKHPIASKVSYCVWGWDVAVLGQHSARGKWASHAMVAELWNSLKPVPWQAELAYAWWWPKKKIIKEYSAVAGNPAKAAVWWKWQFCCWQFSLWKSCALLKDPHKDRVTALRIISYTGEVVCWPYYFME